MIFARASSSIPRRAIARTAQEILRPVGEVEFASSVASRRADAPATMCRYRRPRQHLPWRRHGRNCWMRKSRRTAFKGIPMLVQWDRPVTQDSTAPGAPPQGRVAQPPRRFRHLASRGLSFDAWLFHPQLPELIDLADAFPGTSIILDHAGTPLGAAFMPLCAIRFSGPGVDRSLSWPSISERQREDRRPRHALLRLRVPVSRETACLAPLAPISKASSSYLAPRAPC